MVLLNHFWKTFLYRVLYGYFCFLFELAHVFWYVNLLVNKLIPKTDIKVTIGESNENSKGSEACCFHRFITLVKGAGVISFDSSYKTIFGSALITIVWSVAAFYLLEEPTTIFLKRCCTNTDK